MKEFSFDIHVSTDESRNVLVATYQAPSKKFIAKPESQTARETLTSGEAEYNKLGMNLALGLGEPLPRHLTRIKLTYVQVSAYLKHTFEIKYNGSQACSVRVNKSLLNWSEKKSPKTKL